MSENYNDRASAAITPNEEAIQTATDSYMESWALFRDPTYGGSELVRSEYESVVRSIIDLYLRAAENGS